MYTFNKFNIISFQLTLIALSVTHLFGMKWQVLRCMDQKNNCSRIRVRLSNNHQLWVKQMGNWHAHQQGAVSSYFFEGFYFTCLEWLSIILEESSIAKQIWYCRLLGLVLRNQILSFRNWLAIYGITLRMFSLFPVL